MIYIIVSSEKNLIDSTDNIVVASEDRDRIEWFMFDKMKQMEGRNILDDVVRDDNDMIVELVAEDPGRSYKVIEVETI